MTTNPFSPHNIVLMFHVVNSQKRFKKIINFIGKRYEFISVEEVDEFINKNNIKYKCCHLTFDDGDLSFYNKAFPVLQDLQIPASLFVSPKIIKEETNYWFQEVEYIVSKIGSENLKLIICEVIGLDHSKIKDYLLYSIIKTLKFSDIQKIINYTKEKYKIKITKKSNLTINQIEMINKSKLIYIGPHTINHPILANENDQQAKTEIVQSLDQIQNIIGDKPKYFAYPNGVPDQDYGKREEAILKENGISLAFSTEFKFYNKNSDPLNVPRIGIVPRDNIFLVFLKIKLIRFWDYFRELFRFRKTEAIERKKLSLVKP